MIAIACSSGTALAQPLPSPGRAMARLLRFIPDNATLVEVTTRTIQSRLLLTPTPQLNRIIIGALARAACRYEVGVVAFSFLSNHFHLLVRVKDVEQFASFMGFFNSKLAREVVRLTGWKDKAWSRRYQAIVVSNEEGPQAARLFYVLSNGVKEHLVARVSEWPGVHAAPALLAGTPLEGIWINRTAEYLAKQRGDAGTPGFRGARDAHPGALALLGAFFLRAVPSSNRVHGPGDRRHRRSSEEAEWQTTTRTGCDPEPGSESRAKSDEEVSSPAFSRFPQRSTPGAPPALLRIRRRLPGGGRSVEIGGPARPVSDRQLSASSPVRQGVPPRRSSRQGSP